eukprot:2244997-Ditylum_brightwellii.AAC.1
MSQLDNKEVFSVDTDGTTAITDNMANTHIFNDKNTCVGNMLPIDSNIGVATIERTDHSPESIGIAR